MAQLVKAGLLTSQPGAAAPALARPAAEISLLDVYQALEGNKELLHIDEKTNPQCIVGGNIQASLNVAYAQVQQAAEAQMAAISLQGIISDILQREAAKH